ncbi:MAG: GNAT family N-acetyltransferase [Phycisphaerales bacterium]|nr:GNAT family N-acetyltransferase [Phycisphaerales bacterium]
MSRGILQIDLADPGSAPARCEPILRSVPDWFGIEEATRKYIADSGRYPTWCAHKGGKDLGFVTIAQPMPKAADIYCMAVDREHHGQGIGTALVRHIEVALRDRGIEYLQVKTMGPFKPSPEYARTLVFYEKMGFVRLEELTGLWPGIPCLVLVKKL